MVDEVKVPEDARCLLCGYRLVNLPSQTCPECGRWFAPHDPTTFQIGPSKAGWRVLAMPPSRKECFIFAGLSVWGVIGASGAAQGGEMWICLSGALGVPLWLGLMLIYGTRLVTCWADRRRADLDIIKTHTRMRWVIHPICIILILSTFITPWPLLLRFRLSQSAFDAAVKQYQAGTFTGGQSVGFYYVEYARPITPYANRPQSIWFVTGSTVGDSTGFEYDPLPNHPVDWSTVQVGPSWYTFED